MVGNIVLVFINYSFLAACLISGDNLTWIESASRCILADQQEILTESVSYDASWIGGYHLTTPWVSYLGCFFKIKKLNDVSELHPKSSPAECRFDCQAYNYFALEDEHCRCLNSRNSLQTTDPQNCRSGKTKKYFQVYKSSKIQKDLKKPRHFNDQRFLCSIIKFNAKANKIFLKAEQCDNKHFVVCQTSEKEFSVIDDRIYTFAEAQQKCKMIDYYSVKDDPSLKNFTIEEKTFWTNIRRFSTQRWVDNTTDIDALKDTMKSLRYQRCLSASQSVGYPPAVRPLPCNNIIPFRCSPEDRRVNTADSLNSGTFQHTTPNDTLISLPYTKATSNSSNTTDINTNWHKWDNEYIDRTRITDVFVTIIGITAFLSILITSGAMFALYLYRQKRKKYSLEIQDQNLIKTRRDLYFATEDICNDYLGLQWIPSESDMKRLSMPTLNTESSAYTALNSVRKDTSANNVNTENATNLTMKSNEQGLSTQNVNSGNAAHTGLHPIRPVSSPKYATSTKTKSARLGTSTGRTNNENAAYTAVKLIRHIPSNKVDIDPGIATKSEYDHLDYTLKSDEKCCLDGNEPNRTKQKETDIVYEDPWEEETSKFQRAFSQIRQGMVHRGRSIRKSILKRQSRIRDNDAYTVTELSVDNFVYDSPKAENATEDVAENIIEGEDMLNKAEAMDDVGQCTLRNKVNRQSKCVKPDTRRSSVKLTFQRMFSLKTFKTPASIEQSNNASSPDDNS